MKTTENIDKAYDKAHDKVLAFVGNLIAIFVGSDPCPYSF
jgi:hypothetical protein